VPGDVSSGVKGRNVKLTTHLHVVPRIRMVELCLYFPISFMASEETPDIDKTVNVNRN
jgi:hypothetical protein